jgi:hypothetical protein
MTIFNIPVVTGLGYNEYNDVAVKVTEAPDVGQQLLYPNSIVYVPAIKNVTVAGEPYSICVAPSGLVTAH